MAAIFAIILAILLLLKIVQKKEGVWNPKKLIF